MGSIRFSWYCGRMFSFGGFEKTVKRLLPKSGCKSVTRGLTRIGKTRGEGVLPYKRLMGMCKWIGSHFHDWRD